MMLLPQEICWSNQRCPSPSWNWSIRFNPGKVTLFDFESGVLEFQFFWLQSWQVESACCFAHSSYLPPGEVLSLWRPILNSQTTQLNTIDMVVCLCFWGTNPLTLWTMLFTPPKKITLCCSSCEHVYILTIMWYNCDTSSCFLVLLNFWEIWSSPLEAVLQPSRILSRYTWPTNAKRRLQTFRIFS